MYKAFSCHSNQEVLHVGLYVCIITWALLLCLGTASIPSSRLLHADAHPAEGKGTPAPKALAPAAETSKQQALPKKRGQPHAALEGSAAPGGTQNKSLGPASLKDPVRKIPSEPDEPPRLASASEAQGKHRQQQPANKAPPAKRRKLSKKAGGPAPYNLRADGSNADSMPGIPGSGAAEMTWKQLDKRTDVKRGRFSEREKETLLQAIKVISGWI